MRSSRRRSDEQLKHRRSDELCKMRQQTLDETSVYTLDIQYKTTGIGIDIRYKTRCQIQEGYEI